MPELAEPVDFTLTAHDGKAWRLAEHLDRSLALLFYRGDW
jgi:peroxiredoxin